MRRWSYTTNRNIFYAKYQGDAGILSWTRIEHELRHAQRRSRRLYGEKETLLSLANVHAVNEKGKAPSISTELITTLLMWKRLTLDCQDGGSRFATIHKLTGYNVLKDYNPHTNC